MIAAAVTYLAPAGSAEAGPYAEHLAIVPADGRVITFSMVTGAYTIRSYETYTYGPFVTADAECSEPYSGAYFREMFPGTDTLDLMIRSPGESAFSQFWEGGCMPGHKYERPFYCPLGEVSCELSFYIQDTYYGDNAGGLHVYVGPPPPT